MYSSNFDALAEHDFSLIYFYTEYVQNRLLMHFLSVLMRCDVLPNSPVTPTVMPLSSHRSVKWCIALSSGDMMFTSCHRPKARRNQDPEPPRQLISQRFTKSMNVIYKGSYLQQSVRPSITPTLPWSRAGLRFTGCE